MGFHDRLKKDILNDLKPDSTVDRYKGILFTEEKDYNLKDPVSIRHNSALAYFHNYAEMQKKNTVTGWMFEPIQFKCSGAGSLDGSLLWTSILYSEQLRSVFREDKSNEPKKEEKSEHTTQHDKQRSKNPIKLIPSVVYAALDTQYLNMRVAILPKHLQNQFFEVAINYQRHGKPDNSRGLVNHLTKCMPIYYNIWSSQVKTFDSTEGYEHGQTVFIIEDQGKCLHPSNEKCINIAKGILRHIESTSDKNDLAHIKIDAPIVRAITRSRVRRKLDQRRQERGLYDVFMSYSTSDSKEANQVRKHLEKQGLRVYHDRNYVTGGDLIADQIRNALVGCAELWVLCSHESMRSEWVHTEWGSAWVLDKRIVPVIVDKQLRDSMLLPERLRARHCINLVDVKHHAKLARMRIDGSQMG